MLILILKIQAGRSENLFIVGHGYPGGVWADGHDDNTRTDDFEDMASYIFGLLPKNWQGELVVLTCRAGVPEKGGKSVIEKIQDEFISKRDMLESFKIDSVTIKGGKGYCYGSLSAGKLGETSILKPQFEAFYSGDYEDKMAKIIGKKTAPKTERRSGLKKIYKNPGSPKNAAKAWVEIRDMIEGEMKAGIKVVSDEGKLSVEDTIAALKDTKNVNHKSWEKLLKEQEKEFTFYDMFMDSGEAFKTLEVIVKNNKNKK